MKLLGVNNLIRPFPFEMWASIHGFKFDAVELYKEDVKKLLSLTPENLKSYLERL